MRTEHLMSGTDGEVYNVEPADDPNYNCWECSQKMDLEVNKVASNAICKKPAVVGFVIESECFDALQKEVSSLEKELIKLKAECEPWANAEADGRLVMLPLKPGQTVWAIEKKTDHKTCFIRERIINSISICEDGFMQFQLMDPRRYRGEPADYYSNDIFWQAEKIGETIFLTLEEAEKALTKGGMRE